VVPGLEAGANASDLGAERYASKESDFIAREISSRSISGHANVLGVHSLVELIPSVVILKFVEAVLLNLDASQPEDGGGQIRKSNAFSRWTDQLRV
jgi:hypothetical protein